MKLMTINYLEFCRRLEKLNTIVMDVDGTLTDGQITINDSGIESKSFSVKDGMGIKLLKEAGFRIVMISARYSKAVEIRAMELKVTKLLQKVENKVQAIEEIINEYEIHKDNVIYIGDDNNDIEAAQFVGLSAAVNNASISLKEKVDFILDEQGGKGAIREFADFILSNKQEMRK